MIFDYENLKTKDSLLYINLEKNTEKSKLNIQSAKNIMLTFPK